MVQIRAFSGTDIGRVRTANEDTHYVDPEGRLFLVADGMGGQNAGEIASGMAVSELRAELEDSFAKKTCERFLNDPSLDTRREVQQLLVSSVQAVHAKIFERAQDEPDKRGMGTTLEAMLVLGRDAFLVHVGDSRIYLVRDRSVLQVTQDHSLLETLLAAGRGSREELKKSTMKNAVVNALGATPDLAVDTLHIPLSTGDKFLLCSDGLHEYFDDEEELGSVIDSLPGEAGVGRLIEMANERGGKDNITAIVVWILAVPGPQISRDLKRDLQALKSSALFGGLTLQEAIQALRICVEREARAGEALPRITTGDDTAYIVLEGTVVTARGDSVGPGTVIHPQALVGGEEPDGLAHSPFVARVLAVRRNDFLRLCNEHRTLGLKLLTNLCLILSRHTAGKSE
jgi:PPM family protein phosphatase